MTLFHLCEYSRDDSDYGQMDDRELLQMFIDKLRPEGWICLFTNSNHYLEAKTLIEECVVNGSLKLAGTHKSVTIYESPRHLMEGSPIPNRLHAGSIPAGGIRRKDGLS